MKRIIALLLTLVLAFSALGILPVMAEDTPTKVEITFKVGDSTLSINGKDVAVETPYVVGEGTTLVPLRVITEAFGATVGWEEATQKITLEYPDVNIVLQIGNKTVTVNDHTETLLAAPELPKDTTMVPLRFISETFGATVTYDEETELITVTKEISSENESGLKGITTKERIGDSYYNWSIDTPSELFMEDRTFDGIQTEFTDDSGNVLLITVGPKNEDADFSSLYNDLKKTERNETLIVAEKHTDSHDNQYMQLRKKDAEKMREIYVYFTDDIIYTVNVTGDVKNDLSYLFDIASSFRVEFIPATTHNLSNVVSNMRKYENEKYKFSLDVPADWMAVPDLAENLTAFVTLKDSNKNMISLGIYSASDDVSARALANNDYKHNSKYLSANAKITPVKSALITNQIMGYEYTKTVSGTENEDSYLHDIFFDKGDYVYNLTIKMSSKNSQIINKVITSLKVEPLDKDEIGIILRNDDETEDETREVTHGFWTAQMPGTWKEENLENSNLVAYGNNAAESLLTFSITKTTFMELGLLRAAMEEQLSDMQQKFPGSEVIKKVYQKKLDNHVYYSFVIKVPMGDLGYQYYNYYATVKGDTVISVGHSAGEKSNGEALTAEVEEIISSITINEK
ncbi:MAG: hypothetical protein J6A69_10860 [Clostridia bacterium]|nr:hypothetical protein [Clostridia bacterium]